MGGEKVKRTPNPPSHGYGGEAGGKRSSFRLPSFVVWIIAIIIGGLFVYAGAVKVMDPAEFARDINNYKMLPWQPSVWLALYLPWLEILCGLALLTRVLFRGAVFIVTALMTVFIIASLVAKARGLDITCGCFGHASQSLSFAWHLALDFALLGGLLLLWKRPAPVP